jgi:hypothetical protein
MVYIVTMRAEARWRNESRAFTGCIYSQASGAVHFGANRRALIDAAIVPETIPCWSRRGNDGGKLPRGLASRNCVE